ncbi:MULTISPECIES: hypothetical protein [Sphingobacterium]|jgi:hypothetical protein|nr:MULTISPECIES: hypothetical protein [Sphingobacterium]OFV18973.1 hypothetical protein HMPREF3127_06020 [Sphingobacterium sp. HMSC13C05]
MAMDNTTQGFCFDSYLEYVAKDSRLLPSHIGLLLAMFYYHQKERPGEFFHSSRKKLMHFSRIKSIATYHKCLSDLILYGYVDYIPSWHPTKASRFRFIIDNNSGGNG